MNDMRRYVHETEEITRIKDIVARRPFPDFVTGFDVRIGSFEDDPAVWITLNLTDNDEIELSEMERRADVLLPLQDTMHADLATAGIDRFPFFRVAYAAAPHR